MGSAGPSGIALYHLKMVSKIFTIILALVSLMV